MAVYQVETENGVYEVETDEQSAQPEKMVGSIFGKVSESAYQAGERKVLGNVFERPGAAIRSAIQGKGYVAGAVNPTNVPTFQDLGLKFYHEGAGKIAEKIPEGLGRQVFEGAATIGGMVPSALGLAADFVTNPADILTNIIPATKPAQLAGRAIMSTKAGKALSEIATMPIEQIGRPTAEQLGSRVSKTVKEGIEKAVRPSVIGKRTATQQESYFRKAESAVKDVLDNKPNLEILDKNGSLVVGKNPESLNEALQAVGQTRENIFDTYSPMIKQASADGAIVDGNAIATKLKTFAAQENVQLSNPGLAKYADEVATRWEGKQVPLDVAEQTAKDFNAMLKQKYQQGKVSGADISSAHVDDMVVRMLRNEIADKAGVGDLKNRYGALAELEGDLAKRAIVYGRQNKVGLVESMASIESGADIAGAVAMSAFTGNPMWMGLAVRGIGAKAAGNIIKNINSPDANIARMFKNVEKLRAIPTRKIITPAEEVERQMAGRGSVSEAEVLQEEAKGLPFPSELKKLGTSIVSRKALPPPPTEGVYRGVRQKPIITPSTGVGSETIPLSEQPLAIEKGSTKTNVPLLAEESGESIVPIKKTFIPSNKNTVTGELKGKTPIVSRKKLGNKGQTIIPGGTKKPQSFKTAEEYVASKGTPVYHGTDAEFDVFDLNKSKAFGKSKFGHWFTEGKQFAEMFGKNVKEGYVSVNNPKILSKEQWDDIRGEHAKDGDWFKSWKNELRVQGFDGLKILGKKEKFAGQEVESPTIIAIFDDTQIKTKSQLTAEWEAANKKTSTPIYKRGK